MAIRLREAITLHALVSTIALSLAEEVEAEQDSGMTLEGWTETQRARAHELLGGGRFPLLAATAEETAPGLDDLFEYGLARHLDGFAVLVDSGAGRGGAVN